MVSPSSFKEDLDKTSMTAEEYVRKTSEGKVIDKVQQVLEEY